jgi:hypothetical protein
MLMNRLMLADVGFLEFKGDGESCRQGQRRVEEVQSRVMAEEPDVA